MTPKIKLLAAILILPLSATTAHADDSTTTTPALQNTKATSQPPTQAVTAQNLQQARQQMEKLQFNMLELKTILSRQPHDMTLVKTKTSWIRTQLSNLHDWSLNQTTKNDTEKLVNKFCWLASDMEDEVKRDDMLDSIELQTLLINYTRLENTLSQIEHSEEKSIP